MPNNDEPSQGHPFKFVVHFFHEAIEGFCVVAGDIWDALQKAKAEGIPPKEVDQHSRMMFIAECEKWMGAVSLFLRNWKKQA